MATFTRVNGSGQFAAGTLYSVVQLDSYLVEVFEDDGTTAIDLTSQDGLATPVAEQLVEAIVRETGALMYLAGPAGDTNSIHLIVDGHAVNEATLQARIRNLGAANGDQRNFVSPDGDGTTTTIDIGGTTVTLGTAITVA